MSLLDTSTELFYRTWNGPGERNRENACQDTLLWKEKSKAVKATAWIQNRRWNSALLPLQAHRDDCSVLKAAAPQSHL